MYNAQCGHVVPVLHLQGDNCLICLNHLWGKQLRSSDLQLLSFYTDNLKRMKCEFSINNLKKLNSLKYLLYAQEIRSCLF